MKRPSPRQMGLLGALGLSLAATAWVASREEPDVAPPTPRRVMATSSAAPGAAGDWPGPAADTRGAWPEADVAARHAWGEAAASTAPAPVVVAAPPASVDPDDTPAPPFPYRLVGRMTDTRPRVVLDGAQRSLVLGVGDVVDGQWRIEAIEGSGLRLKRLPDGPSQIIAFTSS